MASTSDNLDSEITELATDLKGLSSGKGVEDPNIMARIRPGLRRVCGITAETGPARARELLIGRVRELSRVLRHDQRLLVAAAFALGEEVRDLPCKKDRIAHILPRINRVERTTARWLDEACERMAQEALDHPAPPAMAPSTPWHTKNVEVSMGLDLPIPEIHERRTIVADQDGLDEVELSLTWALVNGRFDEADLDGLEVDVLHGGTLACRTLVTAKRVAFMLRLPYPLGLNKEHTYAFRIRLAPRHPIEPFYVCTPRYPCESFRLHVRFGDKGVPNSIWKIDRMLPSEIGDSIARREAVSVDPCGEAHAEFLDLTPNLSYGLRWSHVVTAAGAAGAPARR
ncbi:hypothetical protein [Kutzneria sp. NPDC052558]|uniref:hypothetical protein n=1 Tax=Kutzneria sp. NPDC052558 TaxID=3364121 RepID=UPI0037C50051